MENYLTATEARILNAFQAYLSENDMPPTVRELGALSKIKSIGTVHRYVDALIEKGALVRVCDRRWRNLRLGKEADSLLNG